MAEEGKLWFNVTGKAMTFLPGLTGRYTHQFKVRGNLMPDPTGSTIKSSYEAIPELLGDNDRGLSITLFQKIQCL